MKKYGFNFTLVVLLVLPTGIFIEYGAPDSYKSLKNRVRSFGINTLFAVHWNPPGAK